MACSCIKVTQKAAHFLRKRKTAEEKMQNEAILSDPGQSFPASFLLSASTHLILKGWKEMKQFNKSYPNAYAKDNTRYTYYGDDGMEFTLIAGSDGVTEEHIDLLKKMHQKELASDLRYRRIRNTGDGYKPMVCSIDSLTTDTMEESPMLIDPFSDMEDNYIKAEEQTELRSRIQQAWSALSDEQRDLLTKVRFQHIPQVQIAEEEGVSPAAIRYRFNWIEKKMLSFISDT